MNVAAALDARTGTVDGNGCLPWLGRVTNSGYGQLHIDQGSPHAAHRLAWVLANGPIPEGLEIDHLCRNRLCVNPEHMEPVTHAENMRRKYEARTHCKHGHAATPETTIMHGRARSCRVCKRLADNRRTQARKDMR